MDPANDVFKHDLTGADSALYSKQLCFVKPALPEHNACRESYRWLLLNMAAFCIFDTLWACSSMRIDKRGAESDGGADGAFPTLRCALGLACDGGLW